MFSVDEPVAWPGSHHLDNHASAPHYQHISNFPHPDYYSHRIIPRLRSPQSTSYSSTASSASSFSDEQRSPPPPSFRSPPSQPLQLYASLPLPLSLPPPPPSPHTLRQVHCDPRYEPSNSGLFDLAAPPAPAAADSGGSSHPSPVIVEVQSCLSFDPQLLINQLTAQPLSPTALGPRKRKRIPGLSKQQRKERLKQQHREIDARRRRREHSVVARMHAVLNSDKQPTCKKESTDGSDSDDDKDEDEEDGGDGEEDERKHSGGGRDRRKADRVEKGLVLERAVEYMERMQGVLEQMAAHSTAQQRLLRQLAYSRSTRSEPSSSPLAALPDAVFQRIQSHMNSQQLGSASFISASAAMMVISLVTGCVMEVNSRMLACTGWERTHLVNRMMMARYSHYRDPSSATIADWNTLRHDDTNRVLVDGPHGSMVPVGYYDQPAASMALMGRLLAGEVRSIVATWRSAIRCGRVVDMECQGWVGGEVEVLDESGGLVKRPAWLATVYDLREVLRNHAFD